MPIRFSLPGIKDSALLSAPAVTEPFEDDLFSVKVKDAVLVGETRAAALVEVEVAEDDVIELTFDDGVVFCVPASVLRDDIAPAAIRGGGDGQTIFLPPRFAFGTQSRGIGDWVVRAVRVFGVQVGADLAARQLVEHVEGKLSQVGPGPGLWRCPAPNQLGERVQGDLPGDGPVLVFIHGTASHTNGSFGGLVERGNASTWAEIQTLYRNRVFALEHRTLSQSPVENALEVAHHLPQGARLHLVTHSRGGIVGELLCRGGYPGGFDETDLRQFAGPDWQREHDRLVELGALLTGKGVHVDRFVRVACPARGTTLASRRLDRYLSLTLNAIGLIPALAGSPLYGWVKSLLIAVAKKRADPEDLPGLEAQMPESRLVKILNRQDPGFQVDADLSVIAGDIEGSGIWQRLGVLATDLFYREDHDLVVNTWAMTGGGRRPAARNAGYAFDKGSEVSHFNYFRNARTVGKLAAALRSEEERRREFLPLPPERQPLIVRGPAVVGRPKPGLFLLPGIMGSQLASGDDRIWLALGDLAIGKMDRLAIGRPVRVDGPMSEYDAITHYLDVSHEVFPFAFDWRLSVFDAARLLADAVEQRLAASDQPVRFLAHSMGGLVVRALIAARPDLWARVVARPGTRFVMLGTPNRGSYVIPHILLGREKVFRSLALLDLAHGSNELAIMVKQFPGLLDMLPVDPESDVFADSWWSPRAAAIDGDWPVPDPVLLKTALANRQRLDRDGQPDPRYTVYVAGAAPSTPWGIMLKDGGQLDWRGTFRGDGRVTWASGIPPGVPTWYMDAVHGSLAYHPPAFLALQELLEKGTTDRLSREAPPPPRTIESDFPLPEQGIELFPDARELAAAALGFEPRLGVVDEETQLRVGVTLGNLIHARFPVLVGHYRNDGIYSAEEVLDASLGGRLSRRYNLGAYPGARGTWTLVLDSSCSPPGACVIGLGEVGSLSPGGLSDTVARAVVNYAAEMAEREPGISSVGLSTVLIGSGEAGITLQDSIAAILRGITEANRRLAESANLRSASIREVELVELLEDVAVCAARTVSGFTKHQTIPGVRIVAARELRRVPGARRRIPCGAEDSWWRRLRIGEQKDGTLTFTNLTDRARMEETQQPTQPAMAQRLIDRAVSSTAWEPRGAHTLFSLLVPNALKSYAPEERNIVLLLDEKTARFPWELLADEVATERPPFSVRAGVVRQLRSTRYRPQPLAASGKAALVIGDPRTQSLPPLSGAQTEAADVSQLLRSGFQPTHLDRPTPEAVLDALFSAPYRILHFAGHGELRPGNADDPRPVAGMVLDDGLLLTAREIRNLTSLPDLVVINCCYVGAMGGEETLRSLRPPLFAASLATELIDMGVRAVVAAGWAIDDPAARTFALALYDSLLRGETFGEAVRVARQATYRAYSASNTWGAYQCYGDPGFRLFLADRVPAPPRPEYVDPCEVLVEIENLLSREDTVAAEVVGALLAALEKDWPEWLKRADVTAGMAKALLAAGEHEKSAARCLEALKAQGGDLPFDVLETLVAAVAAGASVQGIDGIAGLLSELGWMETLAPAPFRLVRLARYHAVLARSLSGEGLGRELDKIEELLRRFDEDEPDADVEGLLALAEARVLIRERKPQRGSAASIRRLLERLHRSLTEIAAREPARARPLSVRLAILDWLVNEKATLQVDDTAVAGCAATLAGLELASALALARHVLDPVQAREAQLSEKRIRQRETWLHDLSALETRLAQRR